MMSDCLLLVKTGVKFMYFNISFATFSISMATMYRSGLYTLIRMHVSISTNTTRAQSDLGCEYMYY